MPAARPNARYSRERIVLNRDSTLSQPRTPSASDMSKRSATKNLTARMQDARHSLYRHLGEPRHRLERAVGLQDGEKDLIRALVLGRPVTERDAAHVEWRCCYGVEQRFARRLALDALEGVDHEAADHIAFERNEARLGRGVGRDQRMLIG